MQGFIAQLGSSPIGIGTAVLCLLVAFITAMAGGALAGVRLAGKDLGTELAALMGAMFGPTASVPAVLIGLVVLSLL
jgi:hypothetical protein